LALFSKLAGELFYKEKFTSQFQKKEVPLYLLEQDPKRVVKVEKASSFSEIGW